MTNWKSLVGGVAVAAISTAIVQQAEAQVTTSAVRGVVSDEAGKVLSGVTIRVVNTQNGFSRSVTTNASGAFGARNLPLGGLYTVTASVDGYQTSSVENISLGLGKTSELKLVLSADETKKLDTIVLTASAAPLAKVASGPNSVFNIDTLENAPAINRSIGDVLRIDPRVYVDEARGDVNPIQCGGKNPRFNSLTLDGVRLNDAFGLNANGYPTERQPFSYDAIEQVAVELAPFDVQYGGFTACNINAVTKSGTNEFHGSAFYDYTSDALQGSSIEGRDVDVPEFDEQRYGFQVGGPIIKDKLFFSVAYEYLDGEQTFTRGPEGSSAINPVEGLTQAELDAVTQIARDVYGYDVGGIPTSKPEEDEKLLVKLDWNISDNHRAAFTYNYNDGFNITESDGDNDEFEFENHLYERGAELNQYVGYLYSNWTDRFSTEFRLGQVKLDNRQISLGGTDFGEMQIGSAGGATIYIGGDDSRQSNKLDYEIFNLAAKGFYNIGNHNISFGYEREELDVYNLFIQHSETEIRFNNIEDFRNGHAREIYYNNSPNHNPQDAGAEFGYAVNTLYVQDEFLGEQNITVTYGVRVDHWESDDLPGENPDFVETYGYSNAQNFDGEVLVQPRIALTWEPTDSMKLRAGVGRYAGGDPNVWLSGAYSGNNILQVGARIRSRDVEGGIYDLFDQNYTFCEDGVPNGPGYCVPQELVDSVSTGEGRNFEMNALDPDFKIPSEWKFSLGTTWIPEFSAPSFLGGEYVINADLLYSMGENSAKIIRGDLEQVGTTDEGYPIFDSVREPAFILTNTQTADNEAFTASLSVAKDYDNGLNWSLGYAYTDSKDVQPMTSSVLASNYFNRTFFDPQEEVLSTSDYSTKHRFTGLLSSEMNFFGEYATKVSALGLVSSGRPYSIATGNSGFFNFTPFIGGGGVLAPGAERNSEEASWWAKADLRFEQELPGVMSGHRSSLFVNVDNFTNLLNDEWGIIKSVNFPPYAAEGQSVESVDSSSRWSLRVGVRYEF